MHYPLGRYNHYTYSPMMNTECTGLSVSLTLVTG